MIKRIYRLTQACAAKMTKDLVRTLRFRSRSSFCAWLLVLTLGIFTALANWAQDVPAGVIQGSVVTEAGSPIPGATVSLYPFSGTFQFTTTAVTSATGGFTMNTIPNGRYRLCVRAVAGSQTLAAGESRVCWLTFQPLPGLPRSSFA